MRKLLFLFISTCLAQAASANENVFSLSSYKFERGTTETIYVHMDQPEAYGGFQFDLYLPEGVSIVTKGKNKPKIYEDGPWGEDDVTLVCTQQPEGWYRFMEYKNVGADNPEPGEGYIIEMSVETSADAEVGQYKVDFKNTRFAALDDSSVKLADVEYDAEIVASYAITAASADEAMGTVEITGGGESVSGGSAVTVTATPVAGYEFVNWTADGAEVSTENPYQFTASQNIALVANFKAKMYDVKFVYDNGAEDTVKSLEFGSVIPAPEKPVKTGYTFVGWDPAFEEGATVPVDGMTYTATWKVNQYTITFDTDGGSEVAPLSVDYDAEVTAPADPTKTGYTFKGWDKELPAKMPAEDLTLKALWAINQYTITFDTDGGTEVAAITLDYGTEVTVPAAPTKTGYAFMGWDPEIPTTMPAEDITLKAIWSAKLYTITFDTDGGTEIAPISEDYGTEIAVPADPTKTGYTFKGWDKEIPATMPAEDLTLTALWAINQYTITFDTDGGTEVAAITLDYGTEVTVPAAPTKTGYAFMGWDQEIPTTMPAEDLTLKALWSANLYTITFDTDGGSAIAAISEDYGTEIVAPADPTKTGYTFKGWDKEIPATMPAEDLTLTALWSINRYTITFDTDGGSEVTPISEDYNTAIEAPADPTKTGYTFKGWDKEIPATMPAEDLTIKALWSVNQYKLTYMVDGAEYETVDVDYGTAIEAVAEPEKEGYTFSGWNGLPETMPAEDVTVTGEFTVNSYTLSIYLNDELYTTEEIEYGSALEIETPAVPEGYIFDGWTEAIPETMPAHDLAIYGTYSEDPATGVAAIFDREKVVNVYTLSGTLICKDKQWSEVVNTLSKGIYIVSGKKIVIK